MTNSTLELFGSFDRWHPMIDYLISPSLICQIAFNVINKSVLSEEWWAVEETAFNRNQQEFSVLHNILCRDTALLEKCVHHWFQQSSHSHFFQPLKLRAGAGEMKLWNRIFHLEGSCPDHLVQWPAQGWTKVNVVQHFQTHFPNTS